MKKIFIIALLVVASSNSYAKDICKDLPGFKKLGKDSLEYSKCLAKKSKEIGKSTIKKLNTDSKLTDWIKKKLDK